MVFENLLNPVFFPLLKIPTLFSIILLSFLLSLNITLFTFIPLIIIFSWMNSNLAYDPILPGQDFTVTAVFEKGANGEITLNAPEGLEVDKAKKEVKDSEVKWALNGKEGEYLLLFEFNNEKHEKELLITKNQAYKPIAEKIKNSRLELIRIDNNPKKLLNIFGWKVGWLWAYIIFSIIFSMLLRKIIKVY